MCIIACIALILTAGMLTMPTAARAALIAAACIIVVMGIGVACILDCEAGTFECPHCGERFVPEIRSYIAGAHTLTKRRLKCPKCGKSLLKKVGRAPKIYCSNSECDYERKDAEK